MLNFAEQTGSGAVMLVWSFSLIQSNFEYTNCYFEVCERLCGQSLPGGLSNEILSAATHHHVVACTTTTVATAQSCRQQQERQLSKRLPNKHRDRDTFITQRE